MKINWFRKTRTPLRWVFALLAVSVFLVALAYAVSQYVRTSRFFNRSGPIVTKIPDRAFNEMTSNGMQARLNMSNSWFQAGLLVAAAIIGFIFAKKGEANLIVSRGAPEIIMGICAILLLLSSFVCHVLYLNEISYVYFLGGEVQDDSLPDILDWNINYLFIYQFGSLILGAFVAFLTFLSAHMLKGD
ncbi:MAG: hypothetical protein AABM67_06000 [Acidobacteriota bacterium]